MKRSESTRRCFTVRFVRCQFDEDVPFPIAINGASASMMLYFTLGLLAANQLRGCVMIFSNEKTDAHDDVFVALNPF